MPRPAWPLLGAGVVLALLGSPVLWSAGAGAAPWDRAGWSFGGAALVALGWLLAGAGLRPGGNALRGLVLAGALYLVVGWGWRLAFNVGYRGVLLRPGDLVDAQTLLLVLLWPLNVAQALGLFGHGFN